MKFKQDFTTNSSSSSYICEICGEEEHAWDMPDWITYCENEHQICIDHLEDGFQEVNSESQERHCPICSFESFSQSEMSIYLLKTREVSRDEVFAEIKKVNKRRKKLYDSEYITYVFDKFSITEDDILSELKEKYKNHSEYREFLWCRG